jgi:hypothetical protein
VLIKTSTAAMMQKYESEAIEHESKQNCIAAYTQASKIGPL